MSDDIFEAFGDEDTFQDEEAETQVVQNQGQNRTFIIAVAVLGGLLVCALISFGVWALVLNRPQQAAPPPAEVVATVTVEAMDAATATPAEPEATDTPEATNTPEPTPTPVLGPTATPTAEGAGEEMAAGGAGVASDEATAAPTATQPPRRTPTPTRTPRATATPRASDPGTNLGASNTSASSQLSQTGLGEWLLIGAAVLLVGIMITARRLRRT